MNRKRKSKAQKKILVVSVVLAMLIVVGGTFAWFTSKDEVTNKLTAQNNYGVSIVESFTAPDNWTPGQEVNKDVYAANTGNIDAFVKTAISSAMNLTVAGTPVATDDFSTTDVSKLVELSEAAAAGDMVDEVQAVQAGGRLVYKVDTLLTKESEIAVGTAYTPDTTGLYVFERSLGSDKEYAGYYYDADNGIYYALSSLEADKTDDVITGFTATLAAKETKQAADTALTYDFSNINAAEPYIAVTYNNGTEADTADDVIVNIHLAADWADKWTWNEAEKAFYYNDSLKAGEATEKLIDALELDENVKNSAYISFEYDLTVTTESAQVTTNADGEQTADAVTWTLQPTLSLDADGKINGITEWK